MAWRREIQSALTALVNNHSEGVLSVDLLKVRSEVACAIEAACFLIKAKREDDSPSRLEVGLDKGLNGGPKERVHRIRYLHEDATEQ